MKKIITKRLLYKSMLTGEIHLGATEYDGHLTNENILGAIYTIGEHIWYNDYSLYQLDNTGMPIYQIYIEQVEQYQKSWYDLLIDEIKRILRI
jgi:hypothetical protein